VTQLVLPLETRSASGRADFIVASANQQAVAFIDSWPHWPAPAAGAVVLEASALDGSIPDGPLVVENIGPGVNETALFALLERGAPLLLTAQTQPNQWPALLPDLKSRANALLAFALWAPDDALLMGLAVKLFADRQVQVPQSVVAHMIGALERSPGAIRDLVARADAAALAHKRPITLSLIKDLLADSAAPDGP